MNALVKFLFTLFIIALIAFLANPSAEKHKAAAYSKCCELNPTTCLVGGCQPFKLLSYQNFGVFSIAENEILHCTTIGCFGIVFAVVPDF